MVLLSTETDPTLALSAPPVDARALVFDLPTGILSVKLGRLNVDDPSPTP